MNDPAVSMIESPLSVLCITVPGCAGEKAASPPRSVEYSPTKSDSPARHLSDQGAHDAAEHPCLRLNVRVHPRHRAALGDESLAGSQTHPQLPVIGIADNVDFHAGIVPSFTVGVKRIRSLLRVEYCVLGAYGESEDSLLSWLIPKLSTPFPDNPFGMTLAGCLPDQGALL